MVPFQEIVEISITRCISVLNKETTLTKILPFFKMIIKHKHLKSIYTAWSQALNLYQMKKYWKI